MIPPPVASLSIDLDNRWAYLRAAGREHWQSAESYLPRVIERVVEMLGGLDLPLTAFVVGRDLESSPDVDAITSLDRLGHWEIGNHSWNHLPWMHTLEPEEIREEIFSTHDRISHVFGRAPQGFRGPGFSCPPEVLRLLVEADYVYDASLFPTSIAPLARAYFLARTRLRGEQRERAKKLYGGFGAMRQPNHPHPRYVTLAHSSPQNVHPASQQRSLWELPVTVMPYTRTPIHFSYLTFLASKSMTLAKRYFEAALAICRRTAIAPSLLLHPPDFLGGEEDNELAYLPGMKLAKQEKLRFIQWALEQLARQFNVMTMIDHLRWARGDDPQTVATSTGPAAHRLVHKP